VTRLLVGIESTISKW